MPKKGPEFGSGNNSLDLHGLRVDEAKTRVDEFLLEQINQGNGLVKIIHGWGSGKMQQEIKKYLESHPDVKKINQPPNSNEASFLVELNLF